MTVLPAENGRKQGQNWALIGYATFSVPMIGAEHLYKRNPSYLSPRYNHVKLLQAEGVLSYTRTDSYCVEMDTD